MKKYLLIFTALICCFKIANSQEPDTIYIENLYNALDTNWPAYKNIDLTEVSGNLKIKNTGVARLPKFTIIGQASYQSDVVELNLPVQLFTIPELAKDQYKMALDVNQVIYDGGYSSHLKKLEIAAKDADMQQVKSEIYQLKMQINNLFFNALLLQESHALLVSGLEVMNEKRALIAAGITNGIFAETDIFTIDAEIIKIKQQISDVNITKENILNSLSDLTGIELKFNNILYYKDISILYDYNITRPEIKLMELQQNKIDASKKVAVTSLMPKISGFGQAGYGRPGLNMLDNKFDSFYIVGARLSWTPWDWKQTKQTLRFMDLQRDILENNKETFLLNLKIQGDRELSNIKKMEAFLESDSMIIELREKITAASSSKLRNGTIRSSEFTEVLNNELQSKIEMKRHLINMYLSKYNYLVIKGI